MSKIGAAAIPCVAAAPKRTWHIKPWEWIVAAASLQYSTYCLCARTSALSVSTSPTRESICDACSDRSVAARSSEPEASSKSSLCAATSSLYSLFRSPT